MVARRRLGKPRTEAERKANHKRRFGSLKGFPKTRRRKNAR